jgi:hypothetical protein
MGAVTEGSGRSEFSSPSIAAGTRIMEAARRGVQQGSGRGPFLLSKDFFRKTSPLGGNYLFQTP